jgi:hypothetical protein
MATRAGNFSINDHVTMQVCSVLYHLSVKDAG